jgi:hypothetical protein
MRTYYAMHIMHGGCGRSRPGPGGEGGGPFKVITWNLDGWYSGDVDSEAVGELLGMLEREKPHVMGAVEAKREASWLAGEGEPPPGWLAVAAAAEQRPRRCARQGGGGVARAR